MRSFIDTSLAEGTYSLTGLDGQILLSNATEMEVRSYLKEHFALDYARAHASTAPSTSTTASTSAYVF
ncbi:unnamed protein product [Dibothriocephalus latus]|uniref:Uncharacterized protein n=1 Tax=Dibothriocephalus latus TaxID=60516 RepID=A0A3P7LD85_DIBLA|nr:unnamed protein product [Dibothriocephalus latus]